MTHWLTIPDVCASLQISEADWHDWRQAGQTPLHAAGPDGQLRVRLADLERWVDALPTVPPDEPVPEEIATDEQATHDPDDIPAGPDIPAGAGCVVPLQPRHVARGHARRVATARGPDQWPGPGRGDAS